MTSGDVSKPYISAVQRSIELSFRSLSHASLRLSRALAVSERVMHRRLWKLRGHRQLLHPHDWQTRAELQTHLGALAVIQRQKGGGRVFSKDKHEFYDQDAHRATTAAADTAQQQQRSGTRKAEAEAEETEAAEADAARAEEGGAEERRSGSRTTHARLGDDEKEAQTACEQQQEERDGSEADGGGSGGGSEQPQLIALCGDSPDFSGYLSTRLRRQRTERLHSRPAAAAQAATAPSTQSQQEKEKARPLFLSAASRPPVHLPRPGTSPFPFSSSSRSLSVDAQASELMSSIHSRHADAQREPVYAGGRCLSRQQEAAAAEAQNLFAGVKDRWHHTFTELREIEREEEEEQRERRRTKARQQQRAAAAEARKAGQRHSARQSARKAEGKAAVSARRPTTSPVSHRPALPAASGLRPATAGGASSLLSRAPAAPVHSGLPTSFPLPLSLSTCTRLAPIVRLPSHGDSASAPHSPVSAAPMAAAATADSPLREGGGGSAALSARTVYAQQRDAVLRSNFLRFLSATEPQMWRQGGDMPGESAAAAAVTARSRQRSGVSPAASRQRRLSLQAGPQRH